MTYSVDTNAETGESTVHEWTPEEIAARKTRLTPLRWEALRAERNALLAQSDIYVTMDFWEFYSPEQKQAWRIYRQTLRDLPANTTDPFSPVWPAKPE